VDGLTLTYEELSRRGADAVRRGDWPSAGLCFREARALCEDDPDPHRRDVADLNLARVLIETGEAHRGEEGLREILLRATDPRLAWHAAYHLASSLRKQARFDRALSYARRSLERARTLDAPDLLASSHNLLGNILLGQSWLTDALTEYRAALALREAQEGDTRYGRAILEENLGYCLLLLHRFEEGRSRIRAALALAEEIGDRRCRAECLQDLCYAEILNGSLEEARPLGTLALADAEAMGYTDIEENAHYLLGEIGNRTGDDTLRDRHFGRLQASHPDLPFLKEFLCAVDVTGIITLKR